ncbi:MAG TPA: aldehyde dehydrogenase family protein, partial [Polyangiaceae bacterium]|nr:aldehyde dehydrogenase family protein [Polyangiaceae bacterium]
MRRQLAFIAGKRRETGAFDAIHNPYDGAQVSEVALATTSDVDVAIDAAKKVERAWARAPRHERATLASRVASRLAERKEELARIITLESGKPIRYARAEVDRAIVTFTFAADVARTLGGEVMPADAAPHGEDTLLVYERVPRGVVAAISPFNFPLNLAAHKLAPALAVGAPVVLKPPHQAPSAGLVLAEIMGELGAPEGTLSALHASPEVAERLAVDARVRVLSFTGSDRVGFRLKGLDPRKHVLLELGGNAPCIVDDSADLERIVPAITEACFASAGQVCIKAQRLFVHRTRYAEFVERLVGATRALAVGDPLDDKTVVGPLIHAREVDRVLGLVKEAVAAGARVLTGGGASGAVLEPTVLADASPELRVCREEVFGPVATVEAFDDFGDVLGRANATRFGLQASL